MNIIKSGLYAVALATVSQSVLAKPFAYEARSLGMGNIGVATADIAAAPFANPAMLSFQKSDDDFSFLVSVGGFINDDDGMIDNIDRFQAAEAVNDIPAMQFELGQLSGKTIAPEVSGAVAIGIAGETYSMAVSARSDIILAGGVTLIDTTFPGGGGGIEDPTNNILVVSGAKTNEVGFSIASNFEFMDSKVAIGVTPKIISLEASEFAENIITSNTDLSDLTDNPVQDLGSFTTFDAGLVIEFTDNIQIGLTAKNLIEEEKTYLSSTGAVVTLSFDTQLVAGVAYSNEFLTIGADLDLTENDSVLSTASFSSLQKKNLSVGMEVDIFDFVQLRVGMIKNLANGISTEAKKPLYTAGLGFWLGFNLDVAVIAGEGDSAGAFLQAGFKF